MEEIIMKLSWYGHSCFMLETSAGNIIFDPYAPGSVPGVELPVGLEAELVLCSHAHNDHSWADGIKLSGKGCTAVIRRVESFHDKTRGIQRGKNLISVVETEGKRIVHLGDLGHKLNEKQLEEIGTPDVLLIPVGGFFTINAAEASEIADILGARTVIPMHYRGEGFGYPIIGKVDDFAVLRSFVTRLDSSSLDIDTAPSGTVILRCPVK